MRDQLNMVKQKMQVLLAEGLSDTTASSSSRTRQEPSNVTPSVQGKSKKRPSSEQSIVPCKLMKLEKSDLRHGCVSNFDDFVIIANKQEGIKTIPSMDKLFCVMIEDDNGSASKLVDMVSHRTMLASIVATTEKEECLTHFVQLGGLRVLNAWLQEAHKGKIGDGRSKDVQAGVEGLLLMLIRALSKLPVDFDALKSCIVGKSVNKLRGHENLEVQKKARELVDTWKKRVNAQIKSSDDIKTETSISLPSTASLVAQSTKVHNAQSAAFGESVANDAVISGESRIIEQTIGGHREHSTISSPKQTSGEPVMHATNGTSVVDKKEKDILLPVKKEKGFLSGSKKDTDCLLAVKEERNCSSSYSQNNSQSSSSGFMKGNGRRQEETKPMAPTGHKLGAKVRGHTKSQLTVLTVASPHKDSMGKHKGEKILLQKALDGAHVKRNNPKLILRLPNPGRASLHPVCEVPAIDGKAVSNGGSSPSPLRQDHGSESIRANSQMSRDQRLENVSLEDEVDRSCLQKKRSVSSKKSPSPLAFDAAHEGIDLLASVAACEVIEEENFGRSNDGERCSVSTDALNNSFMQDQINSSPQHGEMKNVEQETCVQVTSFIIRENGSSDSPMTSPCRSVEDKGSKDLALTSKERVSCRYGREKDTSATVTTAKVVVHDKKLGSAIFVARGEDDRELVGNSIGNLLIGKIQTASKSCHKDRNDDGLKKACVPSCPNMKIVDSLRSYGEDGLEAVRQGAKEIEQEVEDFKPKVQDEISGSLFKESPICEDFPIGSNKITPGDLVDAHIDAAIVRTDAGMLPETIQIMIKPTCLAGMSPKADERSLRGTDEEPMQLCVDSTNDSVPVLRNVSVSAITEKEEAAGAVVEVNSSLEKMHSSDDICESSAVERAVFDLNEEFNADVLESIPAHPVTVSPIQGVPRLDSSPHVVAQTTLLTMPVAVVAATKGSFVPPSNPNWAKGELGWKGSAATSAFRPAEPRRVTESALPFCKAIASACASSVATSEYRTQPRMLNIDLNVADERLPDDSSMIAMLPSAGTSETLIDQTVVASRELDLNRTDENDEVNPSIITSRDITTLRPRLNVAAPIASRVILDIDLNDGSCNGEESVSQHRVPEDSQYFFTGRTRHNVDIAKVSSWDLMACSTATAMVMPTLPTSSRCEPSYPVVSPSSLKGHMTRGNILGRPFSNDPYPVMAFSSCGAPYSGSYVGFPFGSSFSETHASYNMVSPLCSSSTSALLTGVPSQMVSTGAVISPYGGSYLMGNVGDIPGLASSASWIAPSLDVNTGLEICSEGGRQSIGASQYGQLISASRNFKRKAPEGSLHSFRPGFKQSTWP